MGKKICYIATLGTTIESFFVEQLRALAAAGFEVAVICSPDIPDLAEKMGSRVHYLPVSIPRGVSFLGMLRATREIRAILHRERFDLVQYSTPNAAFCASWAAMRERVPVRNYHLMGLRYLGSHGLMRRVLKGIEKLSCRWSTHIECVSPSNLRMGIEEGLFDESKACVVWNGSSGGVDMHEYDSSNREAYRREIREKYGIAPDAFVFGFVGRITRDKGINELLQAFERLEKGTLLMVGRIEGEESLDAGLLERARQDPRVIFTGQVPENEVKKMDCAMDVLMLPSYREGFGNAIIEAAAMGTPAIVSDIPGPIDAISEGVTGLKVPVKDAVALQRAMSDCMDGTVKLSGDACVDYVKNAFDSVELCQKIVERKKRLLDGREG